MKVLYTCMKMYKNITEQASLQSVHRPYITGMSSEFVRSQVSKILTWHVGYERAKTQGDVAGERQN